MSVRACVCGGGGGGGRLSTRVLAMALVHVSFWLEWPLISILQNFWCECATDYIGPIRAVR